MLRIYKELWYAKKEGETGKDKDLAYMTHTEGKKAFEKRQETGRSWAEGRYYKDTTKYTEATIANTPQSGFLVAECVSRQKTSNKLFRVRDPRGFVVEIPSANLLELLLVSQIHKGVIMEPCIWAREGANHYLVPVSDEEYQATLGRESARDEMVSYAKLEVGDIVRFDVEREEEHTYLGRTKATFHIKEYQKKIKGKGWRRDYHYREGDHLKDEVIDDADHTDNKWLFLFKSPSGETFRMFASGKCALTGKKDLSPDLSPVITKSTLDHPVTRRWGTWDRTSTYKPTYAEVGYVGVEFK